MTVKTVQRKRTWREVIVNDEAKLHATFEPGDVAHQGDLMIVAIGTLPASARPRANRQLTEGNTQGSRHILERGDVYDADKDEVASLLKKATGCDVPLELIGPVFVSSEAPTADDLSHPEHGSQGFPIGTICAVVYQRNLDAEQRAVRSQD